MHQIHEHQKHLLLNGTPKEGYHNKHNLETNLETNLELFLYGYLKTDNIDKNLQSKSKKCNSKTCF